MAAERFDRTLDISAAIRGLRRRLSITQNQMAMMIGLDSLDTLRLWEEGSRAPSGAWVWRMQQLAPDKASREAFGIIVPPEPQPKATKLWPEGSGAVEAGVLMAGRLGLDLQHSTRQKRDTSSSTSQLPSFGRDTRKKRSRKKVHD